MTPRKAVHLMSIVSSVNIVLWLTSLLLGIEWASALTTFVYFWTLVPYTVMMFGHWRDYETWPTLKPSDVVAGKALVVGIISALLMFFVLLIVDHRAGAVIAAAFLTAQVLASQIVVMRRWLEQRRKTKPNE